MKFLSAVLAALVFSLTLTPFNAEAAKRLGGGKSLGMQRQAAPPAAPASAPTAAGAKAPAGAAAPAPTGRSWMGPLAGLAAGLGLAALASHLGFGEELASFMMMALLAVAVIGVIGFIMRKRAAGTPAQSGLRYAGAGAGAEPTTMSRSANDFNLPGGSAAPTAASSSVNAASAATGRIPADFDVAAFARNAKVNFIRLQAANDTGNLDDIKEFTTPEMFAEIKMDISERNGATQTTDVVNIHADVIDVEEDASRYVVSVRFTGLVRDADEPQPQSIDEVWHLTKPREGKGGWVLAGIQQAQ